MPYLLCIVEKNNHETLRQYTIIRIDDEKDCYKLIDEVHIMLRAVNTYQ